MVSWPPSLVTRYELQERIGVGAVAEIFRGKAIAAGGFEKPVAIKRILPHLGQDRRFVEALIAEAKILSQLRHRNIVQIFDVGLGDDGQYFLVMEYVDGMNLADVQRTLEGRRKRLPLDLALHLGAEVGEALDHAHNALAPDGKPMRLVHRDVGPSNVLVSRHGEVKLTDFGLARRPEDMTSSGGLKGKYGYISPEAAAGGAIDARSDVFSMAAIVYELTLGRRLFSHLPDLEAVRAVRECNVPRPRDLDPSLPAELDDVLMSALVRDPSRRVASAGALGSKLRSLRYSLESAAGDPAQELARVVLGVEAAFEPGAPPVGEPPTDARKAAGQRRRRAPESSSGNYGEPTVVSLTSLDPFGDDPGTGLIKARAVLDRFEEEETRLASQPGFGVRETAPTGIFVGDGLEGAHGTGETTFTGTPRTAAATDDESTRVLSPAQLLRRDKQESREDRPLAPRKLSSSSPPPLPGLAKKGAAPPPTPSGARGTPRDMRIEAQIPSRPATPTVSEPPSAMIPRQTSIPPVAGFGAAPASRRWLIIAAIALTLIAFGIAVALLR
jgi:serine/threonine-protein kinase